MTAKEALELSFDEKAARLAKALSIEDYEARSILAPDSLSSVTFWARRLSDEQKYRYVFWLSDLCDADECPWMDTEPQYLPSYGSYWYHEVPTLTAFREMTATAEEHSKAFLLAVLVVRDESEASA
jgi:hypothetical protein